MLDREEILAMAKVAGIENVDEESIICFFKGATEYERSACAELCEQDAALHAELDQYDAFAVAEGLAEKIAQRGYEC